MQVLDEYQRRAVVSQFCNPRLDSSDTKKFVVRLLLTLYGKHALCWSWVSVRNAVWLPAFRKWLLQLISTGVVPDPPDDCFRIVGTLVFTSPTDSSEMEEPNGIERDPYVFYVTAMLQQFIRLHGGYERIESLRGSTVGR